jgi:hypothetical protein
MRLVVWGFPLEITDSQIIHPPKGAEFLSIQTQNNTPVLWALVDSDRPKDAIELITKGTGHPIKDNEVGEYIGTYQIREYESHNLVFHVFHNYVPDIGDED